MRRSQCLRVLALVTLLSAAATAQVETPPSTFVPQRIDSGTVANEGARPEVVISFPVVVAGAPWLRLDFEQVELAGDPLAGNGSILRIVSIWDGAVQELNAIQVRQWRQTSAYFNGEALIVEVLAQPGTGDNRVVLRGVTAGLLGEPKTICGLNDDRVLSQDPRAGRLLPIGCTGWLINDCAKCALTAGHCTSNIDVLQFNVPLSTATGAIQHPPPSDQYSIDQSSIQTNGGAGVGNDYGYFGTFPNSTTGQTAAQAQGAVFTISVPPPFNGSHQIRITGFGTDNTPSTHNQVQQTHVGPWVTGSGTLVQYATDTTGGNSGSPVIHEQSGLAIGIHTHGGCDPTGGENSGTGLNHPGMQAFLANPQGVCFAGGLAPGAPMPEVIPPGVATDVFMSTSGTPVAGSPALRYRTSGGTYLSQPLVNLGGGNWRGTLPALGCADTPEWYFSADFPACGTLTLPGNAPSSVFSAEVGNETVHFSDNFQTDKGWTTAILGATSGQWQRGVPVNDPSWEYDPIADGDGSGQCFLTQNQLGNTDVDGGSVELTSPALALQGLGDVSIQYHYYLNMTETGTDFLRVALSTNGLAGPFVTVVSHGSSNDLAWTEHTITSAQLAAAGVGALTNDVRVRFTANDANPQSIVEAGVDGFSIATVSCGSLGTNYCASGALGSQIFATGSASIAANDLVLHANAIPNNKNGIFLYGSGQQQTAFGNGFLCIGPQVIRMSPAVNSGTSGELALPVNYGALSVPILAGSTWNFQAWFRDGTALWDLSNGLNLSFVP
jgi:V8-like Glu-specific endopeptidase